MKSFYIDFYIEHPSFRHSENGKSKTKSKKKSFTKGVPYKKNKEKSAGKNSSNDDKTSGDELTPKKKQSNGDTKSTNSTEKSQNSGAAENNSSNANGKPKKQKQYPATVSVFVGKIPRGTRVKELKEVIIAKGVKPINILWKGGKGYNNQNKEEKHHKSTVYCFGENGTISG